MEIKKLDFYKKVDIITDDENLNNITNKAIEKLEGFNKNSLSTEYKQAIKLLVFDILYYNKKDKILTVPLPTGSGKSMITELTLANMYINDKLKKNCGTIILKLTIDDCNETASHINTYVGKRIAYPYHTGRYNDKKSNFIKPDELLQYPILILTHEGFKNYTQDILNTSTIKEEEKFTVWTDRKVDKIKVNYNAFNRNRLIIDEEISNVEPINITMDKINNLENAILNMGSNKLFDEFNNFIINIKKQFIKSYSEKANKLHFTYFDNIEIPEGLDEAIFDIKDNEINNICGIDLGINNFATLTNNIGIKPVIINGKIIKSINQYYNKKLAYYKSILKKTNNKDWSNKLNKLTIKRNNKIKNYMHKASKQVIEYCKCLNLDTIIIGNNPEWKQNSKLNKKVNQTFVQIPYENFIDMIQYKAQDVGIKVIITEENYTSGTSFLDNELPIKENYNKNRRIFRGLFRSNTGRLINSDVNGSLQIIKKVIPNTFDGYGIEGLDLTPLVVNL